MGLADLIVALRKDAARVKAARHTRPARAPGYRRKTQLNANMLEAHNADAPVRAGNRGLFEEPRE